MKRKLCNVALWLLAYDEPGPVQVYRTVLILLIGYSALLAACLALVD